MRGGRDQKMKNEIKETKVRFGLKRVLLVASAVVATLSAGAFICSADAENKGTTGNDLFWSTDLNSALAQAKSKNKYVLADVYTDWCGWCKRLDRDTFSDPQMMTYLNGKFVCVKVNAEQPNGRPVASKYRVGGFPCALVFDPTGKMIGKLSGYNRPAEYQKMLEDLIKNPPSDPMAE